MQVLGYVHKHGSYTWICTWTWLIYLDMYINMAHVLGYVHKHGSYGYVHKHGSGSMIRSVCMCLCVYIYVRIYICTQNFVDMHINVTFELGLDFMYDSMCTYIWRVFICIYIYICLYTHVNVLGYVHLCDSRVGVKNACMIGETYVCMIHCTYTYIFLYTYIYLHTCLYT